ncbi:MAG TPA: DUF1737 domain-containing protein [Candidatus Thalassarchaeaceae archaeon]|nr:DUF1737 domain-containing protein [Candidatus Thalassarchaeaceae archaeon]
MQYKIVEHMYSSHLRKEVQVFLDTGWKLQGGVSVGASGGKWVFAQAMVKD